MRKSAPGQNAIPHHTEVRPARFHWKLGGFTENFHWKPDKFPLEIPEISSGNFLNFQWKFV